LNLKLQSWSKHAKKILFYFLSCCATKPWVDFDHGVTNTENLETWVETDTLKNIFEDWNYTQDTFVSSQKYLKTHLVKVEVSWVGHGWYDHLLRSWAAGPLGWLLGWVRWQLSDERGLVKKMWQASRPVTSEQTFFRGLQLRVWQSVSHDQISTIAQL